MPSAARLGDQILHSQALPQAKHGWWHGLLKGALIGAAIVAVSAVAVVATVGTGGLGAPFAIGAAAVVIGSALRYGQVGFHEGAQAGALQGTRAGPIKTGSRNVFINGKAAALACVSLVSCTQHGDGKQVAQGSQTVQINGHRMARVGDGGVCGFVIGEGSPNVFVGTPPASCHGLTVGSEIPKGLSDAVDMAGKIGGYMELVGGFVMGGPAILNAFKSVAGVLSLGAVLGIGYGGSRAASGYAKAHGMSASDQMMFGDFGGLGAALVGGGALSAGARVFGGTPVVPEGGLGETPVEAIPEATATRPDLSPEENFPGQQSGNNCAPQSCQQVIRQATGNNYSEAEMEQLAQGTGAYDPASGTQPGGEADILNAGGVPSHTQAGTPENIQTALDNGQGVVSGHRAGDLWEGDPNYTSDPNNPIDGGHAVHTTGVVRDADGNVTGYVINDTGTGTAGRVVPADQYEGSLDGGPIAVTNDPIRTPAGSSAEAAPTAEDAPSTSGEAGDRGAAPPGGYNSALPPAMQDKVLMGQQVPNPNSPGGMSNRVIGGHSPDVLTDPNYASEVLSKNPDGTTTAKFTTQLPNGNLSKLKTSTLAPDTWTNQDILTTTDNVAATPPVETSPNGTTMHRDTVNGVQWETIKDPSGNVTSSYPTGGNPTPAGTWY